MLLQSNNLLQTANMPLSVPQLGKEVAVEIS